MPDRVLHALARALDARGAIFVTDGVTRRPRLHVRLTYTDEAEARAVAEELGLRCFRNTEADGFIVEAKYLRARALLDDVVDLVSDDTRALIGNQLDKLEDLAEARHTRHVLRAQQRAAHRV